MSCSSINKTNDNSYLISSNDYHRGENQSITVEQPQNKKENKKENKKKKNKNKNTPNTSSQPTNNKSSNLTFENLQGEWVLYSIPGKNIVGDDRPYFIFEFENINVHNNDKSTSTKNFKLYAFNGCNTINADVKIDDEKKSLFFENSSATLIYCTTSDAPYEIDITNAINFAKSHKIFIKGNESYLHFYDVNNKEIIVLRKANINFFNGIWRITKINNDGSKCKNKNYSLAIDVYDRRVHCNFLGNTINGKILLDANNLNSITFFDLVTSQQINNDITIEKEILVALESVNNYKIIDSKKIALCDKNGNHLLELVNESDKYPQKR